MRAFVERFDETARRRFAAIGQTVVYRGELLRHPVYTRFLHWSVAIFFILALLSGFAIYSPWLFRWIAPLFGGGPTTRALHPWFSLFFTIFFALQFMNWLSPMAWREADRRFVRQLKEFAANKEKLAPEDTGFFNGGQKLYFWAIVISALIFLLTGVVLWFDHQFPRVLVTISYVMHDLAALLMLGGFIIHLYEATAAQPGTFRSMINGAVTEEWAWTHHPAWYRAVTGRDPRESYERARRRQAERERAMQLWEREQDERERAGAQTAPAGKPEP